MDSTQATYEGIRKNIVEYLSSNPTFKDYNFTAPAISTLIDALAYTSHYLIRYANFSLNECFLDTAQLRSNVVSHAKEIGYIPHQYKTAKVKLRLRIKNKNIQMKNGYKVPADTTFLATSADNKKTYTFRTTNQYIFVQDTDKSWYADVEAIEGVFVTEKFLQDEYYTTKYYLINDKIDTDYIDVIVHESESDTIGIPYSPVKDLNDFSNDAKIYFLQEAYNGKMEIYFGDGKIANKLNPYSIIKVKYLVTNGSLANNIVNFTMNSNISSDIKASDITIEVLEASSEGMDREDIESIRFTAPQYYQAQDRAVTTSDYNALLINKFGGWFDSVISWGGEDNIPPQYSSVFVCAKPKYTEVLSPSQKSEILNFLETKSMPCIDVNIIDPSYIEVDMKLIVDWYAYKTSKQSKEIYALLQSAVEDFFKMNITTFSSKFKYSKFLTTLSELDKSIDSILTEFTLKQYLVPIENMKTSYRFEFLNKLVPGSIKIGEWKFIGDTRLYTIADGDKDGKLYIYGGGSKNLIGEVDYNTGVVSINNYMFTSVNLAKIPVICTPVSYNINLAKKYLLKLNDLSIEINENV